jgi:DNA invertase Pin-like site-specific DNA recombinase
MIYADFAASGSTVHRRPEFSRMLTDAEDHQFDIIIAEDIDRLARGEGDAPKLRQRLEFLGIARCTPVPTAISPSYTLA